MKPHMKVIQRNGVDIFVTSSMRMKPSRAEAEHNKRIYGGMRNTIHNQLMNSQQASQFGLWGIK